MAPDFVVSEDVGQRGALKLRSVGSISGKEVGMGLQESVVEFYVPASGFKVGDCGGYAWCSAIFVIVNCDFFLARRRRLARCVDAVKNVLDRSCRERGTSNPGVAETAGAWSTSPAVK